MKLPQFNVIVHFRNGDPSYTARGITRMVGFDTEFDNTNTLRLMDYLGDMRIYGDVDYYEVVLP